MSDAKSVTTPLAPHFKLSKSRIPIFKYCRVHYVCQGLAYVVSQVSRFRASPGKYHRQVVKWAGVLKFDGIEHSRDMFTGFVDSELHKVFGH